MSALQLLLLHLLFVLRFHTSAQSSERRVPLLELLDLPHSTEYEIVVPYEVDPQGQYISHAVAHHHRRKRSTTGPNGPVHFKVHGLGQDFHLELQPSSDLLAPGFIIQTLGGNGTKSVQVYQEDDRCFYQGSLRSSADSLVALATCAGMMGLVHVGWLCKEVARSEHLLSPIRTAVDQRWAGPYFPHCARVSSVQCKT